jgi:hypothetical protein
MSRRTVAGCAAVVATLLAVPAAGAVPAAAAPSADTPSPDFNGDGYADLVINAPHGTVAGVPGAGYVSIVYGSPTGGDLEHPQNVTRDLTWVPGTPQEEEAFGRSTAVRDLDRDGYDDLVVVAGGSSSLIVWGSAGGLSENTAPFPGDVDEVAGADINGDGKDDLVTRDGGGIQVRFGPFSRAGSPSGVQTVPFEGDQYLEAMAVGDMNGDGRDDVITSHVHEERQYKARWYAGTARGISSTYKTTGAYTKGGVVADVDRDGYGDLVGRDVGDVSEMQRYEAGAIRVVYGSASGPSTRTKKITQDTAGVPGVSENGVEEPGTDYGDQFGYALAAGDVTGDGYPDIVVGVPGEDLGTRNEKKQAGAVVLLKGGRSGLTGTGAQAVNQSTPRVPGASENDDNFGASVTLADFDGDKRADLAAAAPLEDGIHKDSGAVWPMPGTPTGLDPTNITTVTPAKLWAPEAGARFGEGFAR